MGAHSIAMLLAAYCTILGVSITEHHETNSRASPTQFSFSNARQDLVFVLDSSTSVEEANFRLMIEFVQDLLEDADLDNGNVRVGVVTFSTRAYVMFHLNSYRSKYLTLEALDDIPYRYGHTNIADALKVMRTEMFIERNGDREGVDNVAFVLTSSVSNIDTRNTIPEAEQAKEEGIRIVTIGIGLTTTEEVEQIASKPLEKNKFLVEEFSDLKELRRRVFSSMWN